MNCKFNFWFWKFSCRPACYPKRCDICREKFVGTHLPNINCEATCGQCSICLTNPGAFPFCNSICRRSYSYCVATCKTDQKICLTCAGFCHFWKEISLPILQWCKSGVIGFDASLEIAIMREDGWAILRPYFWSQSPIELLLIGTVQ